MITRERLVAFFGTVRNAAIALGVDATRISHWDRDEPIPTVHLYRLVLLLAPEHFEAERLALVEEAQRAMAHLRDERQYRLPVTGHRPTLPRRRARRFA